MATVELRAASFVPALQAVNAMWHSGDFVGLAGPNGAGKSTLLRLAAGVWKSDTGTVTVDGTSISALSVRQRARRIAYLPQVLPDDIAYTVQQFVEMGRFAHHRSLGGLTGECQKAVRQAIEKLNLTHLASTPMSQLSGGERQRVAMARCIAQSADILLLDEPISNLDVYYQLDILTLLQGLARRGMLVVVAIHHLEFAAQFCSQVVLMHNGGVVAAGPADEVLTEEKIQAVFGTVVKTYRDPFHHALRISHVGPSADGPEIPERQ